jgi:hypothetical protein
MVLSKKESVDTSKFGKFELHRPLTDYELEHLDEFMKFEPDNEIDPRKVSLTESVNRMINKMQSKFNK